MTDYENTGWTYDFHLYWWKDLPYGIHGIIGGLIGTDTNTNGSGVCVILEGLTQVRTWKEPTSKMSIGWNKNVHLSNGTSRSYNTTNYRKFMTLLSKINKIHTKTISRRIDDRTGIQYHQLYNRRWSLQPLKWSSSLVGVSPLDDDS